MRRSWSAPEVIQTSEMDCGPAVLASAMGGLGVPVHLGHLREACQTDVDGTSIDTLQDLAAQLGMDPLQTLVPVDHLPEAEALSLPAVVVVAEDDGRNHFVLLWRRLGPWVQVMDPAHGGRWMAWRDLLPRVYRHRMVLPEATWGAWLQSPAFASGLAARLARLGLGERLATVSSGDEALWLDAACREVGSLVAIGAVGRGAAGAVLDALRPEDVPTERWTGEPGTTSLHGVAVVLQLRARPTRRPQTPSVDLRRALAEVPEAPLRTMLRWIRREQPGFLSWVVAMSVGSATLGIAQATLLKAAMEAGRWLQGAEARVAGGLALVAVAALLLLLGQLKGWWLTRTARRLELRLRRAVHERLPRLDERVFASRRTSDLAERAHVMVALRTLPDAVAAVAQALAAVLATMVGLLWLDPGLWLPVLLAGATAVGLPMLVHPLLARRELRRQTVDGALARVYLGAMVGAAAVWAHDAHESLRRDHEELLSRWQGASVDALVASTVVGAAQKAVGMGLAVWMVADHLLRAEHAGVVLLLVYWAVGLPKQGETLARATRRLPALQGVAARLLELVEAPATLPEMLPSLPESLTRGAVTVSARDVVCRVAGQEVLRLDALELAAGEHVAVVGASGAGKSSLVSMLLGSRSVEGELRFGGQLLDEGQRAALRRRVAWVDPSVRLWNEGLLDNVTYGEPDAVDVDGLLREADLLEVVGALPAGLSGALGEGGALLSGGQGQRVRLARGLARQDVGLVLLDEPFRGLERDRRQRLLGAARAHWRTATMLCVTHDLAATRSFPRVLVVDGGRIVEDGSPRELLERGGAYAALVSADEDAHEAFRGWRRWSLVDGQVHDERMREVAR